MTGVPDATAVSTGRSSGEPTGDAAARMPYLPALDGIRALAVLAVVVFHANETWLTGGFLGVDVFFVVSGFLITALLVAERERAGGVDLRAFWARRARRLLPALALVLAATSLYAIFVLGDQLLTHFREVLAAVVYVTNWDLILREVSYFEFFERPSQLRHLWSLAVEEQFYLLWPLLFAGASRFVSRRALLAIVLLLAAASLIWMTQLYRPGEDPSRVYFGSDPRAFTILLGVALGLFWRPWRWRWPEQRRDLGRLLDVAGVAGLVVVAVIMQQAYWREAWLYPWGLLGASLGSVALIAAVASRGSKSAAVLGIAPLRWLGLRSYGVYLWHWPVLLALRYEVGLGGWELFAAGAALSAALAEVSYRWVETPIRRGEFWAMLRRRPLVLPRRAWTAVAVLVFAAAAIGLLLISSDDSSAVRDALGAETDSSSSFIPAAAPAADEIDEIEADEGESPLIVASAPPRPVVAESNAAEDRPLVVPPPRDEPVALPTPPAPRTNAVEPFLAPPLLDTAPAPMPEARPETFNYAVRPGDSPGPIAKTFGTTVEQLVELNGERILEVVHVGDVLAIPCPNSEPCALIEIATRGAGCVRWRSALGEGRACRGVRALVGLPVAFDAESGQLASPAVWEWGGGSVRAAVFELTPAEVRADVVEDAGVAAGPLIVRFGVAPLAIGDSVMVGAARLLSESGLDVDAVGARTAYQSMKALEEHLAAGPREVVVFHGIGFEFVDTEDFDRLMRIVADVDHLIVLTRQFPPRDPWIRLERDGNELIRRESAKYDKVTVIDWNQITDGREDELTTDGTHLRPDGLALYVQTIVDAIAAGPSSAEE